MATPTPERNRGAILYEQVRGEHQLQLFGDLAAFGLILATGVLMIVADSSARFATALLGALTVGLSLLISLQTRWWPFRLYEEGIEPSIPRKEFFGYSGMRYTQFHQVSGKKPNFLIVTRSSGKFWVVGGPNTKKQMINTRDFERVANLIVRGVAERGFDPKVSWRPEAWAEIESLPFCGRIIVLVEALARESGAKSVDKPFLSWARTQPAVAGALKWSRILGGTRARKSTNGSP